MDSQEEPTVVCSNCDKPIPESKSFLHEAYCCRNIIRCSKCNEPIHKNEVEAHDKETHNLVPCKHCRRDFEAKVLADHVENCPQKPRLCQFCNCEISSHEYLEHIYQCGSRTRQCTFCNKSILVRDLEAHEAACEVEQFTRQEAGLDKFEEDDELVLPGRREAVQGVKSVPRKRFEPVRREPVEQNKKRLTKLSNIQSSLDDDGFAQISNDDFEREIGIAGGRRQRGYERQKTQEEADEDLARELNEEHYHGNRNPNKKKINEKSRNEIFQENVRNQLEEEFFGAKKEKRLTRMDKKKAMEEEEEEDFSNTGRRNNPSRNAKKKAKEINYAYEDQEVPDENENEYEYEYDEYEAEYESTEAKPSKKIPSVKPNSFSSLIYPLQQRHNDIDPEMHQFLDENDDAELQRAIQASLQSYQN